MKRSILISAFTWMLLAGAAVAQQTYDYKNKRGDNVNVARDTKNGQAVDKTGKKAGAKTATVDKSIDGTGSGKGATSTHGKTHKTAHKSATRPSGI